MIKLVDLLIEVKKSEIQDKKSLMNYIADRLSKDGYKVEFISKPGKPRHIRTTIPGEELDIKKIISSIMKDAKLKYDLNIIDPKQKGSFSGSFKTYLIQAEDFEPIAVVNTLKKGSTIRAKSLTPKNLGLVGKTYNNLQELGVDIESNLNGSYKEAISLLYNDVVKKSKKGNGKIDSNFNEVITLDQDTIDAISKLSQQDINAIANDFGEVLGAVVLSKKFKTVNLIFPSGNEPLIDFIVNGYRVSSKSGDGAAASLTKLISDVEPDSLTLDNLYRVLQNPLMSKSLTSDKWIEIAKNLDLDGLKILSKIMKVPIDNINSKTINDYIVKKGLSKAYDSFKPFYDYIKSTPTKDVDYNPKKYYGIIVGPLSKYVADEMNKDGGYLEGLKELISKFDVKQLYLDVELKKGTLNFYIKSFMDPSNKFVFVGGLSANNPDNKNISFKLK